VIYELGYHLALARSGFTAVSHSRDLREKAIKSVEQGGLIKDACQLFKVSRSSFQRWRLKQKETGTVLRKLRSKSPYKINNEELRNYVKRYPDAYLNEIAEHFQVTDPCIFVALKRLNITRKKVDVL